MTSAKKSGAPRIATHAWVSAAKPLIVAGVMSGTSADGVDVAVCRIGPGRDGYPKINVLGHAGFPYPKAVRATLLGLADAPATAQQQSQLNWLLGEIYADCVNKTIGKFGTNIALVGCHGQTVYHQNHASRYLGRVVRATWQMGEPSVIAERLRVPVVSDFRPADVAAGGQGAPLVPILDYFLFRSSKVNRVLQNLGGIGNLTAMRVAADSNTIVAFDTGPANMVIDGCMQRLYGKRFDRNGAVARRGRVLTEVVQQELQNDYYRTPPPKSCGREQFGHAFVTDFIDVCHASRGTDPDIIATATAFTAATILDSYRRFVAPRINPEADTEFLVAGGGARNGALMQMLRTALEPLGVSFRDTAEFGLPAQAKEAVAFALLAWLTWHGLPGNVPSATGASRPVVLGKICYA